ncbi:MAG: hypothetical protein IJ412_06920 [Oscillospiraceae bacterium]|nr:hypothetical protein [Oscillospiraceae bacterium]
MDYYTQRHGMRRPVNKTHEISVDKYALLLRCCEKYYDYVAWKYPEPCPDGSECCGLDHQKLVEDIRYEIPTLYIDEYGAITAPRQTKNVFENKIKTDSFDQYALLDYIEFIGENVRDLSRKVWHSYYGHHDLGHRSTNSVFDTFRSDINGVFCKTGLLYELKETGFVERIEEYSVLDENTDSVVEQVSEPGLRELLKTAMALHRSPRPEDRKDAVEKIWDALERMKTYYSGMDKKDSAAKIVNDVSGGVPEFVALFNAEFKALTDIGNNFRIRHHETNRTDITDLNHYDYFFNRCLSLIVLALQYLE